jgi:hypothetical protein
MKSIVDYITESKSLTRDFLIAHPIADDVRDYLNDQKDCRRVRINFGGIGRGQQDWEYDCYIIPNKKPLLQKIKSLLAEYDLAGFGAEVLTFEIPQEYSDIEVLVKDLETSKLCADDLGKGKTIEA